MQTVERDRAGGAGLDGGCVAGRRDRQQRGCAEQHRFAARRAPVGASLDRQVQQQKGREQHQKPEAHEPHVAGLRLEQDLRERADVEGRGEAVLEERGLTPSTTSPDASAATVSLRADDNMRSSQRRAVGRSERPAITIMTAAPTRKIELAR